MLAYISEKVFAHMRPSHLLYQGAALMLQHAPKHKRLVAASDVVQLDMTNPVQTEKKLIHWLRQQTLLHAQKRSQHWALLMGIAAPTVKVRAYRRRVGCCHPSRSTLTFHHRLIQTPNAVFDYVVIHELAHLIHPNHSKAFWAYVAKFDPHYKTHHKWTQQNAHLIFGSLLTTRLSMHQPTHQEAMA